MQNGGAESSFAIPLEREVEERLSWFIQLRWLAAGGILLGTWLATRVFGLVLSSGPLYLIGFVVLAYNVVFLRLRGKTRGSPRTARLLIVVQIVLDWVALLVIIYLTWGIRSPLTLIFSFHLIIAAILLSRNACYQLTVASSLLLGLLAVAQEAGWITPAPSAVAWVGPEAVRSDLLIWAGVTLFFVVTTYLVTSIARRLREKEEALYNTQQEVSQALREMESLYELGQLVNSTLDLQEVLNLIAEQAARLLNMKACFIRLFDKTGTRLYIGGAYGLSQAYLNKGPVEVSKSLVDLEALRGGVVQVLEVGDDHRFQYREEARQEGLRSMLCVPVQAKNRVLGVIRVYSDKPHVFSEREQRFLRNLANLGAVAIENARAYAELQALNEEKVWFARMAHHQLRSPLAAIQGILDALEYAGSLTPKQKELVARARRRLEDAFSTIRDFLDLAAAQRPPSVQLPDPVGLREALDTVLETVQESAERKKIRLEVEIAPETTVRAEVQDLERIFQNLLDNAVKYTPEGGKVRLTARKPAEGKVVVEVCDTGIGIRPEDREKIFEGFFRTREAKATGAVGTGLGLSIVKRLVERLGGTIELESEPGRGTCFRVFLPTAEFRPTV